ncbi:uroporphyrinogen decarboxylase family protein [Oscillospiraceae bacterium MB08-C2-2]|nr:uroporphyrinogen decarboxylase family protein [Oscillospiraceae bacterium MB08-C2-2]
MNKRERVFNLLDGKPTDRVPAGFWLHFPKNMHHSDAATQAHLDYINQTDTDILKIMNENLFYTEGGRLYSTEDLPKFRGFTRKDKLFQDQMEITKRVVDATAKNVAVVATVHGLVASTHHSMGHANRYGEYAYGLVVMLRENPAPVVKMMNEVAESLIELIDCSTASGADGIYYADLGGEAHLFTDEEFAQYIAPLEKKILNHAASKSKLNILHICKANTQLSRYADYNAPIVNWAVHENKIGLLEGSQKIFPNSIVLGGFDDRSGILVDGTDEEIASATNELLDTMEGRPYILGADCTLPTEIPYAKIRQVVAAAEAQKSHERAHS